MDPCNPAQSRCSGIPQLRREDGQRTPFLIPKSTSCCDGSKLPAQKETVISGNGAGEGLLPRWETTAILFEPPAYKLHKCQPVASQIFDEGDKGTQICVLCLIQVSHHVFSIPSPNRSSGFRLARPDNKVVAARRKVPMLTLLGYSGAASPGWQILAGFAAAVSGMDHGAACSA